MTTTTENIKGHYETQEVPFGNIDVRPKNWLVPVALLTLREKCSHGYKLMERLAEFGFEQINPGTLYRTLRQMEKKGLCETTWVTSVGRPPCRVYSITDAGEEYLEAWAEGCKKYQQVLDSFFLAHACR
ncbi:MAG: Transcriptional regulator, PadR family [uncultured Rubrobacteraceae bacterium]|uniref:Transcriptional regulator, PadR family n=1 Tax=uncultured Rubrobacteraceae bacterium TaxID=349277 RepID=A0A6J4QMC4_9ACTN|nr:MAG: Transcriptional regulator, PadR family [uncultured Rubrobacteraceae bacterium]